MVLFVIVVVTSCSDGRNDKGVIDESNSYTLGKRVELVGTNAANHLDGEIRIARLGGETLFYTTDRSSTLRVYDTDGNLRHSRGFAQYSEQQGFEIIFSLVLNSDSSISGLAQTGDGFFIVETKLGVDSITITPIRIDTLLPYALPTLLDLIRIDVDRYLCPIQFNDPGFSPGNSIWKRKFSSPTIAILQRSDDVFVLGRRIGSFHETFRNDISFYDVDGSGTLVGPSRFYHSFLFENRVSVIDCNSGDTVSTIDFQCIDESELTRFDYSRIHDNLFIREYYYTQPRYKYLWASDSGDTVLRMFIPPGSSEMKFDKYSKKNWQLVMRKSKGGQKRYTFEGTRYFSDVFLVEDSKTVWLRETDSTTQNAVLRRVALQ